MSVRDAVEKLSSFISALGALPKIVGVEAHDRLLAFLSHLPQLTASALMQVVGDAVGADGLIVEMHPNPEKAMSDGAQSLDPKQFAKMMADLKPYIALWKQARMAETATV